MRQGHLLLLVLTVMLLSGCSKPEPAISGYQLLLVAEPYQELMQQEVDQFLSLYPNVRMEVRSSSTRGAIVSLLNDSVTTIVIDRPFNEEEKQVAQQASKRLVENKIADDGVAIIVHKQNALPNISTESAQRIISRTATDWQQVAESRRSGPIDLVLTGRNSGMYELLQKKIFNETKPLEPNTVMASQRDVIQYVAVHPNAVGFVAASILKRGPAAVKVVPVLTKSANGELQEYFAGQQELHESLYPFHYSLYLYNTEAKAAVGVGFSALVLSQVGQKIFQESGLVPVSIPYRTIQLHAE